MTICVESYIGEQGDSDGVKLEEALPDHSNRSRDFFEMSFRTSLLGADDPGDLLAD